MRTSAKQTMKTTIVMDKGLLEEIDCANPFRTRTEFLDHACRGYLEALRRSAIDTELAAACRDAAVEDAELNDDWEETTLETWK